MAASRASTDREKDTVRIVFVGRRGAGKSTLNEKVFDVNPLKVPPLVKDYYDTEQKIMRGIKFIITNAVAAPGLHREKGMKTLCEHITTHPRIRERIDVFVYCLSIDLSSKFQDANQAIMERLQKSYGKEMWKKCVLALTFSNMALDKLRERNKDTAMAMYKEHLNHYATMFQEELKRLKADSINVKTIFGFNSKTEENITIPAIPVGSNTDNQVLPDTHGLDYEKVRILNWREVFIMEILKKRDTTLWQQYLSSVLPRAVGKVCNE